MRSAAFIADRHSALALLRLAAAQVFPQRSRQPRAAVAGLLRVFGLRAVVSLARHGIIIIRRSQGFASSQPSSRLCLAPMGADMAVSAAFAPPESVARPLAAVAQW